VIFPKEGADRFLSLWERTGIWSDMCYTDKILQAYVRIYGSFAMNGITVYHGSNIPVEKPKILLNGH
jgi:hypothetical protein